MQQIVLAESPRAQAREHLNLASSQLTELAREFPEYREAFTVLARCAREKLTLAQVADVGKTLRQTQESAAQHDRMVAAGLGPVLEHLRTAYELAR
jgi:hypothetical protein